MIDVQVADAPRTVPEVSPLSLIRNLLQPVGVARDLAGERVQVGDYTYAFGLRRRTRHIQSGSDHGDQVRRLYFEFELAADDPSGVEQVFD
jgi:hypothetical protein